MHLPAFDNFPCDLCGRPAIIRLSLITEVQVIMMGAKLHRKSVATAMCQRCATSPDKSGWCLDSLAGDYQLLLQVAKSREARVLTEFLKKGEGDGADK